MTGTEGSKPKLRLHADALTTRDMIRARTALGGDPYERLSAEQTEDQVTFIVWCLLSRDNPAFTWDDALDTPFGAFEMGDETPPPTPEPGSNGASPAKPTAPASGRTPTGSGRAPSAASTTG
jgi:hypothetical protein